MKHTHSEQLKSRTGDTIHFVLIQKSTFKSIVDLKIKTYYEAKALLSHSNNRIYNGSFGLAEFSESEIEELKKELEANNIPYEVLDL